MTLEPKDSLPGAEPRRLSDDQPAEHFSMRQRVATGKSVPFDQSPLPTPAPNPFIGHDPRGRAIAAEHPPALPVNATMDGSADSLTFGLLQFALQQLDRDPDELSESERLLLKSAEVLVEQLHSSLGQLTKQRSTASKSTRRRSTSTKSKKKKTTSTKKTSRKRSTKR